MPYLQRGASRIYYEVHGNGPPLVLLHGVGGNHASWFHQIVAWRDTWQVIVADARGFGNSSDAEGLGRAGFVDDLLALFDTLSLPPAVVVAQSMGGGTAANFAVRHPARVRALVLADTLVGLALPGALSLRLAEITERARGWSQLDRVLARSFVAREPVQAYLYTALASLNTYNVSSLPGVQASCTPAQLTRLVESGTPVLFVVGDEDVLFPAELVQAVHQQVAGSQFVRLDRAGHSAYFETPEAFNRAVTDWIDKVSA